MGDVADLEGDLHNESGILVHLQEYYHGLLVFDNQKITSLKDNQVGTDLRDAKSNSWLRPLAKRNRLEAPYVAYGNEPSLGYVYGEFCLVLKVDAYKDREAY